MQKTKLHNKPVAKYIGMEVVVRFQHSSSRRHSSWALPRAKTGIKIWEKLKTKCPLKYSGTKTWATTAPKIPWTGVEAKTAKPVV